MSTPLKCTRCGKTMGQGITIEQTWIGADDFGGDAGQPGTTMSVGGPGKLIPCLKCHECGHSATLGPRRVMPKQFLDATGVMSGGMGKISTSRTI